MNMTTKNLSVGREQDNVATSLNRMRTMMDTIFAAVLVMFVISCHGQQHISGQGITNKYCARFERINVLTITTDREFCQASNSKAKTHLHVLCALRNRGIIQRENHYS